MPIDPIRRPRSTRAIRIAPSAGTHPLHPLFLPPSLGSSRFPKGFVRRENKQPLASLECRSSPASLTSRASTSLAIDSTSTQLSFPRLKMATVTRQPFAPLDGARLQTLTSLKNRQNGTVKLMFGELRRRSRAWANSDQLSPLNPRSSERHPTRSRLTTRKMSTPSCSPSDPKGPTASPPSLSPSRRLS